jgi:hypothetical protein
MCRGRSRGAGASVRRAAGIGKCWRSEGGLK